MELQLAQNDPRGQDWCKVNLLVTDKSHSGTPFSLYHLIMTLLCSGQVEHEERDILPSRANVNDESPRPRLAPRAFAGPPGSIESDENILD